MSLLLQDMTTELYGSFGCDNISTKAKYNSAWVYTKVKTKIYKSPKWGEDIELHMYVTDVTSVRTENEMKVLSKKGELLAAIHLEACVIDLEKRKLKKLNTIGFPEKYEVKEEILKDGFNRMKNEFEDKDKKLSLKVKLSDIDYTRHTNNTSYIRFIINSLSADFFDEYKVDDFEIHYMAESRENENLEVYKKQIKEENKIEFMICEKDSKRECVRARIIYSKK